MGVITTLVVTWVEQVGTYTGEVSINNAWECGELIAIYNDAIYSLYKDSMLQCIETLIPSSLAPPELRG